MVLMPVRKISTRPTCKTLRMIKPHLLIVLTPRKLIQVLTMTFRFDPVTKFTALSIVDLELAGNRTAALDHSYRIQDKGVGMRFNRIALHVNCQRNAYEP